MFSKIHGGFIYGLYEYFCLLQMMNNSHHHLKQFQWIICLKNLWQ